MSFSRSLGVLLKVTPSSQPLPFALCPVHHEGKFPLLCSYSCDFLPKSMGLHDHGPSDLKLWFKEIFPTKVVSSGYFGQIYAKVASASCYLLWIYSHIHLFALNLHNVYVQCVFTYFQYVCLQNMYLQHKFEKYIFVIYVYKCSVLFLHWYTFIIYIICKCISVKCIFITCIYICAI